MTVFARCAALLAICAAPVFVPQTAEANADALRLVNQLRAEAGRSPLRYSRKLEKAARKHAFDMQRMQNMTHTGSDGSRHGQRARAVGYNYCYSAENVARGPWDTRGVIQAWANSPGHMRNMMNTKARDLAVYQAPGGYWVMMLGRPGCRQ